MQATLLAAIDRCAEVAGLLRRPFDDATLIAAAQKRTGFTEFGTDAFREPLRLLLRCYAAESDLSLVGRMAARWDVIRFLTNLLRLAAEERADPAITTRRIAAPIFITGLPRSGTTFLHSLLAEDPGNLVPRYWQTVFPYPPVGEPDRRVELVSRQLRMFERLAPDFPVVHPVTATSPQECSEITAHVFRSLRFDTTHAVPSYRAWLDAEGHEQAYRFHKRFLQHLQQQSGQFRLGGGQWVLKCPDHIFAMPAIRAVYPDARFVFVHRDPTKVLASVTRLTEILRQPFTRHLDRRQLGRQESDRWAEGAARLIQEAEGDRAGTIFHVRHTELVGDPRGTVAALYRHFGVTLAAEGEARIQGAIEASARRERRHNYRMEDFGLDPEAERRRFADYIAHFQIGPEAQAKRTTPLPAIAA
jgi:Sulfotransferase family